jgi:hypothetical protein
MVSKTQVKHSASLAIVRSCRHVNLLSATVSGTMETLNFTVEDTVGHKTTSPLSSRGNTVVLAIILLTTLKFRYKLP